MLGLEHEEEEEGCGSDGEEPHPLHPAPNHLGDVWGGLNPTVWGTARKCCLAGGYSSRFLVLVQYPAQNTAFSTITSLGATCHRAGWPPPAAACPSEGMGCCAGPGGKGRADRFGESLFCGGAGKNKIQRERHREGSGALWGRGGGWKILGGGGWACWTVTQRGFLSVLRVQLHWVPLAHGRCAAPAWSAAS